MIWSQSSLPFVELHLIYIPEQINVFNHCKPPSSSCSMTVHDRHFFWPMLNVFFIVFEVGDCFSPILLLYGQLPEAFSAQLSYSLQHYKPLNPSEGSCLYFLLFLLLYFIALYFIRILLIAGLVFPFASTFFLFHLETMI